MVKPVGRCSAHYRIWYSNFKFKYKLLDYVIQVDIGHSLYTNDYTGNGLDDVTVTGDLTVNGTNTTINSTTLTVDDKNIVVAQGSADAAAADGAGLTVDGASATLTYASTGDKFVFNKQVDSTVLRATSATDVSLSKALI